MSDDFGTVNVNRGQRAREIEVMRAHYRRHREALVSMSADAPTESLASAYQRLIHDIDLSLTKLDDLEGRGTGTIPLATPPVVPPVVPPTPGDQPIARTMYGEDERTDTDYVPPYEAAPGGGKSRLALMLLAGLLVLGVIGWLVWRGSSDRKPDSAIVDTADTTETTPIPDPDATTTTTTAAVASELAMTPTVQNYGTIRKGTRATRQFEINNHTDAPITVSVGRSACRCLFYEYVELVPPKGKESITVTIDGARAKAGELRETVKVTSKKNPAVSTTFQVEAEIR